MAVFLVILTGISGGLYWKYLYLPAPANIDPDGKMAFDLPKGPSIAVLPLENLTGDNELDYFCDGITKNIISALSYIPELFVIADDSTFAYREKQLNVQQIGKALGARYLINGSIHKSPQRIRIIVQLINANTGVHEWTETYDRELGDILKLQDEIAYEILKAMNVKLTAKGSIHSSVKGIKELQEYKKTLKGWSDYWRLTPESNKRALYQAEELIEMNPQNIDAYVLLANVYISDIWNGECDNVIICMSNATEALRKALSMDNTHYRGHLAAANLFLMRKDHGKAIDSAKMSISLNPNFANAYAWLGFIYVFAGEPDKAIDYINKSIRLNPLPPSYYYMYLGLAHATAKHYKDAIEACKKCIELNPDNWPVHIGMITVYGYMGDEENAERAVSELLRILPDFSKESHLKLLPFKYETTRDFFNKGLSKAGLID